MGQIKEEVEGLMTRLEVAAAMDNQSVASQRHAVHKLSMLGDLNTVSALALPMGATHTALLAGHTSELLAPVSRLDSLHHTSQTLVLAHPHATDRICSKPAS